MSDPKVNSVKLDYCGRFIQDLYACATTLSAQAHISQSDKTMFLVKYRDVDRRWQQMESSFAIVMAHTKDELSRSELEAKFNQCQEMLYSIQVLHTCLVEPVESKAKISPDFHLPKITLARFSGNHIEWPNFINIFNSLIHDNIKLSCIEKMHYLVSVLEKEPLSLIKHLPITNENYQVSYRLLTERYENKRLIADKHVDAILSLQNLNQLNVKALSKFINTIKESTSALQALGFDITSWSFLLLHIILKKMCLELRTKFESSSDTLKIPAFEQLMAFLENQLRILENVSGSSSRVPASNSLNIMDKPHNPKGEYVITCPCCRDSHAIYRCSKFGSMAPLQRKNFVIQHKLCFNCLRTHQVSKCTSTSVCQVCRGRHHTMLHISTENHHSTSTLENQHLDPTSASTKSTEPAVSTYGSAVQSQSMHSVDVTSTMVLGTAFVCVQDVDGHYQPARALIDSGSQVSLMTENLAQRLRLPRTRSGSVCGLGASSLPETQGLVHCNFKSARDNVNILSSNFIVLKRITGCLPTVPVSPEVLNLCTNLVLADGKFTTPGQIDLLLGIEHYDQILDGQKFSLGNDMPTAHSSIFGWIIMGKSPTASKYAHLATSMACTVDLNLALTRFREVEEPPKSRVQDPEDIECENHFSNTPHTLQTFKGNCVSQIQALTPNAVWRHVPSTQNPADSASRGLSPSELANHTLWWSPAWLEGDPSSWPGNFQRVADADLPGVKTTTSSSSFSTVQLTEASLVAEDKSPTADELLTKFSSFPKLQTTVAWCKRFINNARSPAQRRHGPLSVNELNDSVLIIVKLVQSTAFAEVPSLLRANKVCKGPLMRLNPFLDSDGLLRVGGRLVKSNLEYASKHPLLLPKSHHVTKLLVDHYHRIFLHPGLNTLLNLLQRNYWILSARRVVRNRIFQCQRCYRLRPKSIEPFMADLPANRVTSGRPFQRVGVDFAGPFTLKTSRTRNAKGIKAYMCIFVCFSTKCCHLELVSELSTDAFLACFDRFVSRRGLPTDVYSDCGTNFVGARNYLKEIAQFLKEYQTDIQRSLANHQIVWHFNPPASPHMGGLWESAVRSAKLILNRIIGDRSLVFEELATIFSKVEAALNSRPLCPISSDPNDLESLTPGHFLIGQPLLALPERDSCHESISPLKRWQLVRQINQHFWKRWQEEYLHTLQHRPKWFLKSQNLKVGDLVLLKEQNLPPLQWRKARVIRICPGTDGTVRVVELKTSSGTLLRPTVKLCPLLPCADQLHDF